VKEVKYHGVAKSGLFAKVTMTKAASESQSIPMQSGLCVAHKRGSKAASLITWGEVLYQLKYALEGSPEMCDDLEDLINDARAVQ